MYCTKVLDYLDLFGFLEDIKYETTSQEEEGFMIIIFHIMPELLTKTSFDFLVKLLSEKTNIK